MSLTPISYKAILLFLFNSNPLLYPLPALRPDTPDEGGYPSRLASIAPLCPAGSGTAAVLIALISWATDAPHRATATSRQLRLSTYAPQRPPPGAPSTPLGAEAR